MSPIINFGFVSIRIYSLCILVGIIFSYFLIMKEALRHSFDKVVISDLIFYIIVSGIIGARLYYCIFNFKYYGDFISIFKIWEGGLAIHGGLLFGFISAFFFCKKRKLDLLLFLDFIVVGLIIAQSIGRWGNFFNGEAHGGIVSYNFLKSLYLPSFIIDGMHIDGHYYFPTFIVESIWCLIGFFIMIILRHRSFVKIGYITSFYLFWYGIERFFVESFRTDSLMLFSFKMAQIVSFVMICMSLCLLLHCFKRERYYNDI